MFEAETFHGIRKDDFTRGFGNAYQRTFTPGLINKAWEATGIFPFNDKIVPPEKLALSETTSIKYTSSIVHATPVRKVMEAFTFFKVPPPDLCAMDVEDEGNEEPDGESGESQGRG